MATKKVTAKARIRNSADEVSNSVLQAEPEDETTKKVKSSRKAKAIADSAELTVEKVTNSLTKAQLDISKTLGSVRELFESRIEGLETLDRAIEAKKEELEEFFDKEIILADLRDLALKRKSYQEEWDRTKESSFSHGAKSNLIMRQRLRRETFA